MEQRTAHQTSARHATAQQAAPKPHVILQPPSGWQAVHLPELWQARDLLLSLAARDVKLRYRQTALGILWVVLQPLIAAGIFTFVFGKVARLPAPEGVPYLVFSFAGLLAWNAFNATLTKSSSCLVGNAQLVSKVYFPRLILPLSTVVSVLLDFAVSLVVMALLLMIFHVPPHLSLLLLPAWLGLIVLLALGVGLYGAALMVSYRDVQYVLPVATQFLLYASPVGYALSAVPARWRDLFALNPLTGLLEGFRWSLLGVGHLHVGMDSLRGGRLRSRLPGRCDRLQSDGAEVCRCHLACSPSLAQTSRLASSRKA